MLYIPERYTSSWKLKNGKRNSKPFGRFDGSFKEDYEFILGSGNLDECNGAEHKGKYRYFATQSFPFFPRCH